MDEYQTVIFKDGPKDGEVVSFRVDKDIVKVYKAPLTIYRDFNSEIQNPEQVIKPILGYYYRNKENPIYFDWGGWDE